MHSKKDNNSLYECASLINFVYVTKVIKTLLPNVVPYLFKNASTAQKMS